MPESLDMWMETFRNEGPMLILMLLTSIAVVAVALARLWVVISARLALRAASSRILPLLRQGQWEEARTKVSTIAAPVRDVLSAGLERATGKVQGDVAMAMSREQKRAMGRVRSTMWMLGSTGALMPFVGLFGTVVGVMSAFQAIGQAGTGGVQVVSGGIAAALVATAAGLFVALEAIIFFNILQALVGGIGRDLGLLTEEVLELDLVRRQNAERPQ